MRLKAAFRFAGRRVLTSAAAAEILPSAPLEDVTTLLAEEDVPALAASELVSASPPTDQVVSREAGDAVVPTEGGNHVAVVGAHEGVVAGGARDRCAPAIACRHRWGRGRGAGRTSRTRRTGACSEWLPIGVLVESRVGAPVHRARPVGVHYVDLIVAVAVAGEGDLLA